MSISLHIRADRIMETRKDILESAMQSALLLKNIKTFKALNKQKKITLTTFKKNIKEISSLISELKLEDISEPKTKKIPKKIKIKPKEIQPEIPKEKTKLEKDLEDIQERLKNLSF